MTGPAPPASDVGAALAGYLDWYFEHHPVHADTLGAAGYSERLGDFGAAAFEGLERERSGWLSHLGTVATADADERIDRDLVIATLSGQALLDGWAPWRRDPSVYLGPIFTGLFTPFLHRLRPEPELVDSAVARLSQVPAALEACRANMDPALAAPLLVRRALGQARTGPDFLTSALPAQLHDDTLRARLAGAAAPAVAAFETTISFLDELAERATGDWRMGEQLYSGLLRQRELLDYGADELHRRGRVACDDLDSQLRALATAVPGGQADWRATMESLQADHPPTLEAMRAEYEAATQHARTFLADRELVSFADGEQCRVVPAPPYQRPLLAVASYLQPPGLTSSRTGHFFVPYTPDGASDEEITQRLRTNARAQLPTISVHEAYPGHHWHLSWAAGRSSAVRAVHRSSYFVEGWALYAEGMMRDQGYFTDPAHELAHLDARILRAARMVVDTALHCGEMQPDEATRFMTDNASLTPNTAAAEVDRYCAWPTQAPSYLTGCLEIEQMRAESTAAGHGGLRDFHDTLAASGALPLGLARSATASL